MQNNGILRAQDAIETLLRDAGEPIEAGQLLKNIREKNRDIRDIDLREAVWILIGRGTINMNPDQELTLSKEAKSNSLVNQPQ